jgi:filamentous hemagglutinin family protein
VLAGVPGAARAQASPIAVDGTLGGGAGPVAADGAGVHAIPASLGKTAGGNLFHSFSRFSVPGGATAAFTGPGGGALPGIANVVSRVTGSSASSIEGVIDTTRIPGASFYLVNPNGVFIGPYAEIYVDGSFHVSTADYLRMEDGSAFFARPPAGQESVVSVHPPSAFGFLDPADKGAPHGTIQVAGSYLRTTELPVAGPSDDFISRIRGQVSLIGGDVRIEQGDGLGAYFEMPASRLNLASVRGAGEVRMGPGGLVVDGSPELGQVEIVDGALFDVRDVSLRAGGLRLVDSLFNSGEFTDPGGRVDLQVTGDILLERPLGFDAGVLGYVAGDGAAPDIRLAAGGTVEIRDGGFVLVRNASDTASGGSLTVEAGSVRLVGGSSPFTGLGTQADGSGDGGDVTITAGRLELRQGAEIRVSTFGAGRGGDLGIAAGDVVIARDGAPRGGITVQSRGARGGGVVVPTGDAGEVTIRAARLALLDAEAKISASTDSTGQAGSVLVEASEWVTTAGVNSGIFSSTRASALGLGAPPGDAGDVTVRAPLLRMVGPGRIEAATSGDGDAGTVRVEVARLELTGGAQVRTQSGAVQGLTLTAGSGGAGAVLVRASESAFLAGLSETGSPSALSSQTRGAGGGGEVRLTTPRLTMTDGALIGADTGGDGDAGAVSVEVGDAVLSAGARISSDSGITVGALDLSGGSGAGGAVSLTASGDVVLSGAGTRVSTRTRTAGDSGQVSVQARRLVLSDRAQVSASSAGAGLAGNVSVALGDSLTLLNGAWVATEALTSDGGNITITAPRLVELRDSEITTSVRSGFGGGGNIFIDPDFVVLQNSQIVANAFGGPGGNIRIIAGQLIADPASLIDASSRLGIDGVVRIEAPDTDVSGSLAVLPESFLDAASQLRGGCGAARSGLSSLVQVGRGGIAPGPEGYLPSLDLPDTPATGLATTGAIASAPWGFAAGGGVALALAGGGCDR